MLLFFVKYEKYNIRLYINKLVVFNVVDYTKKPHKTIPHSMDIVDTHVHCETYEQSMMENFLNNIIIIIIIFDY